MPLAFIDEPEDEDDLVHPCILEYGPPKTGKSGAAVRGAKAPVVYLNADLPNALVYPRKVAGRGVIKAVDLSDGVLAAIKALEVTVQKQPEKIDRVVVDPIGELYARLVRELSGHAVSPALPVYQAAGYHVESLIRTLAAAPVVSVLIAHDFPVKDEASGTVERLAYTGSASNPSLSNKIMGLVDVIAYTGTIEREDGSTEYVSTLVNAKGRRGGDRWNVLGRSQPTDVGLWVDLIRESLPEPAQNTAQETSGQDQTNATTEEVTAS